MTTDPSRFNKVPIIVAIVTLLGALITAGVMLYIHYDTQPQSLISRILQGDEDKNKSVTEEEKRNSETETTTMIHIEKILIPPINFKLPSSFYLELRNENLHAAKNFIVTIDFGEGELKDFEYSPMISKTVSEIDRVKNIVKLRVANLEPNESLHLYGFLTLPFFREILISSGNLRSAKKYTYKNFRNDFEGYDSRSLSGFETFLMVLLGLFILVMAIFFTVIIMDALHAGYTKLSGRKTFNSD